MVKKFCGIHQGSFTPGLPRKIWPSLNLQALKTKVNPKDNTTAFSRENRWGRMEERIYEQFKDTVLLKIWQQYTKNCVLKKAFRKQKTVFNKNAPISKSWWMPQIFFAELWTCSVLRHSPSQGGHSWHGEIPMSLSYKNTRWQDDG